MSQQRNEPENDHFHSSARRQILKVGAATGAVALTSGGCALLGAVPAPNGTGQGAQKVLNQQELKAYVAQTDNTLATLARVKGFAHRLPNARPQDPGWSKAATEVEVLGRKALRSLTFAGLLGNLAPENQQDPLIQAQVRKMQPELDETVFSMSAVMSSASKEQRLQVQDAFRNNPRGRKLLVAFFDGPANDLGVPRQKRKQMLRIIDQVSWRMQKQPAETLFDEYVAQVEKVARKSGQLEQLRRHVATATTRNMLWSKSLNAATPTVAVAQTSPDDKKIRRRPLEKEPKTARGPLTRKGKELTAGGILFGVGLASVAATLGLWLGAGNIAGMFLITPASVITLVGLITLFVGLARSGPKHKPSTTKR